MATWLWTVSGRDGELVAFRMISGFPSEDLPPGLGQGVDALV